MGLSRVISKFKMQKTVAWKENFAEKALEIEIGTFINSIWNTR